MADPPPNPQRESSGQAKAKQRKLNPPPTLPEEEESYPVKSNSWPRMPQPAFLGTPGHPPENWRGQKGKAKIVFNEDIFKDSKEGLGRPYEFADDDEADSDKSFESPWSPTRVGESPARHQEDENMADPSLLERRLKEVAERRREGRESDRWGRIAREERDEEAEGVMNVGEEAYEELLEPYQRKVGEKRAREEATRIKRIRKEAGEEKLDR